jgi:hypothetical protein
VIRMPAEAGMEHRLAIVRRTLMLIDETGLMQLSSSPPTLGLRSRSASLCYVVSWYPAAVLPLPPQKFMGCGWAGERMSYSKHAKAGSRSNVRFADCMRVITMGMRDPVRRGLRRMPMSWNLRRAHGYTSELFESLGVREARIL